MPERGMFATVVLDVDSTLSGIEGIDWLAARRGARVARNVSALTRRAMRGETTLESVYAERLALVAPTRADVETLACAYVDHVAAEAGDVIRAMREAGVRVVLVSAGIRAAVEPLAYGVGIAADDLHAVTVRFAHDGTYVGFEPSLLVRQDGKRALLESAALPRPILAVGDGAPDALMKPPADVFCAYIGFVRRAPVVSMADITCASFAELQALVLR